MHSQITRNGIAGIDKSINPTESHSFRYFRSQRCDIYIVLRITFLFFFFSGSLILFFFFSGSGSPLGLTWDPLLPQKCPPSPHDPTPALA